MTGIKLGKYNISWKAIILITITLVIIYYRMKVGDGSVDLLTIFEELGLR